MPAKMPAKTLAVPKLHTVEEASPLLRMGRSTLYRAIKSGKVHYTLDPVGRIRFTDNDIAKNIADGSRPKAA